MDKDGGAYGMMAEFGARTLCSSIAVVALPQSEENATAEKSPYIQPGPIAQDGRHGFDWGRLGNATSRVRARWASTMAGRTQER